MLHVALHWSDCHVDDVALLPFAVKHAAWLHNRLPNRVTGITAIEMLTSVKADHRDLLRSHVWGCPVYVLDPKLQSGQKIPKWNKRSRLGQFLGFSEEHSSLIANVRHLRTGHVSPQYHCVYDDLFQTVFGAEESDEVTDTILELLWDRGKESYGEEEYDEDGLLVYQPPPLNEVWLDEEDRRERKTRLRHQRNRTFEREKKIERKIVDRVPEGANSPRSTSKVPDLVSRGDSSVDSSKDSSTLGSMHESEGEMWADHPGLVPPDPEPPSESPTPRVVPPDDGVIDGNVADRTPN